MLNELLKNPAVLVQGITGKHGSFHTAAMISSGTHIVAGVTPGKAGEHVHGIPVFNDVATALQTYNPTVSVVFVPAPHAKSAMIEALNAGIKYIICITEGIPVHVMTSVLATAASVGAQIIGPNCPGVLLPGIVKLGIIPVSVGMHGRVAVVSRSGTLTYEAAASLSSRGIGQRYIVGIGGDRMRGTTFVDCLRQFEADAQVSSIVLIGEIGGRDEQEAANFIRNHVKKPVFAYVVGHSAPPETQLGHAGAIMGSQNESAAAKTAQLAQAGAHVSYSLPELIDAVAASVKSNS